MSVSDLFLQRNLSSDTIKRGTPLSADLTGGIIMKAEYKIRSVTYKVERSFVGTKEASDLVRERIIRAGRKASTESAPGFSVYQKKNEKIS